MKLYIICNKGQANNAIKDMRGRRTQYVTSAISVTGTLRWDRKKETYYLKNKKERFDISIGDVRIIAEHDNIVSICSDL